MSSELPKHLQLPSKPPWRIYNSQNMNWFEIFFRIGKRIISKTTTKMIAKPVQWKNSVYWGWILLKNIWRYDGLMGNDNLISRLRLRVRIYSRKSVWARSKGVERGQRGCSSQTFFVLHKQTIRTLVVHKSPWWPVDRKTRAINKREAK